jgi:ABC-2 type transport system permease protein
MLRYLRLLRVFAGVSLQGETAYRFEFLMRIGLSLANVVGELFTLWVVFANTKSLAGWSPPQVVVLLGVFRMMVAIINVVIAPNMRATMEAVRDGTLDFLLTKPAHAQFLASLRRIVIWPIVDGLLGLTMVVVGCWLASASLGALTLLRFVLTLAAGGVIIYSFWLALTTTVFWVTRLANIEMVFWNVFHAGRYPLDVYRPWVQWTLTFILPLAFLTTFPAAALVKQEDHGGVIASLIVAPAALLAASWYWRLGLRRYSGASA